MSILIRITLLAIVSGALSACLNLDVNGYRVKGGSTGAVRCQGACP